MRHLVGPPRRTSRATCAAAAPTALSLLVVDGERALAEALADALIGHDHVSAAVAASDPKEASAAVRRAAVDVVIVGTDSEGWDPLAFLRSAAQRWPDVEMVAMSAKDDPDHVAGALMAGAGSWVPKRARIEDMATVIVSAARGESWVPPVVLRKVLRRLSQDAAAAPAEDLFGALTERESEILDYAVLGYSRGEIAAELGLSVNTVRTHVQHILSKLGVHTTLEAVTLVLRGRAAADVRSARTRAG